jgi:hypothetical protein
MQYERAVDVTLCGMPGGLQFSGAILSSPSYKQENITLKKQERQILMKIQ